MRICCNIQQDMVYKPSTNQHVAKETEESEQNVHTHKHIQSRAYKKEKRKAILAKKKGEGVK